MSNVDRIAALIVKGYSQPLEAGEHEELQAWAARSEANRQLLDRLNDKTWLLTELQDYYTIMKAAAQPVPDTPARVHQLLKRVAVGVAAIAAVIFLVPGVWRWLPGERPPPQRMVYAMHVRATDSRHTDSLRLADRTRVWLNTSTALYAPDTFATGLREVTLSGEAYFEVEPDAHQSFLVKVISRLDTTRVQVLGTHFNIRSGAAEGQVVTTVLKGQVNMSQGTDSTLLNPGQEAVADGNGLSGPRTADTSITLAWKNNYFECRNVPINRIMQQLKHWFGIEVEYYGSLGDHFSGLFERKKGLPYNLHILEATNRVTFIIHGHLVRVVNK